MVSNINLLSALFLAAKDALFILEQQNKNIAYIIEDNGLLINLSGINIIVEI